MTIKPGAFRFNTDSMKLEIFRGSANYEGTASMAGIGTLAAGQWEEIQATSPEVQTGGTRGVCMGGHPGNNTIDYVTVPTTGDATNFGDLNNAVYTGAGLASRTRALYFGGEQTGGAQINVIDFVTIASTGDATDFGVVSGGSLAQIAAGVCNGTRGIVMGGYRAPARLNEMSYVTVAQTGNTVDFGDLIIPRDSVRGCASQTRGIAFGGYGPGPREEIEFITMSTLGNAADFGDAIALDGNGSGASNSIRGIFSGGSPFGSTVEYITISTLGNALDFGDNTFNGYGNLGGMASPTRAVFAGGSPGTNAMEYVQIMTTGDTIDFGDLSVARNYPTSVSNGHGGL